MTIIAAFIGGWELLLIAAVPGALVGVALLVRRACLAGLKGRPSSAQGKALGSRRAENQALKGRHNHRRVSPFQGLIDFRPSHPGLCPGLTNDAPVGLNSTPSFIRAIAPISQSRFTHHLNPQESV